MTLETSIENIKGIGPERAKLIKNVLGLSTVEDMLNFYPIRYLDKSKVYKISMLEEKITQEIQLKGKITQIKEIQTGKVKRLIAKFNDGTGNMELVWFRYSKWLKEQLPVNQTIYIFGKIYVFNQQFSMPHPEIDPEEKQEGDSRLKPIYPSSEKLTKRGLNQKFFQNALKNICKEIPNLIEENFPEYLMTTLKFVTRQYAFLNIHFPKDMEHFNKADFRLKFEESFFFQLGYGLKKLHHKTQSVGNPFPIIGNYFNDFYKNHLPFDLTNAQKRVLKEIRMDMKRSIQMNRLLQGDVGSGKTIVAILTMLLAIDNGFQNCLMAPTEILAQQHYHDIKELLKKMRIKIRLFTGSTKVAERKVVYEELENGTLSILVGTHAVLEDNVKFKNLGLAIIDEQHRFGVAQRAKLWKKNKIPPHILIMTATPIPRTLAMSFYSDLDISIIDEVPVGRKPIITAHRQEKDRLYVYNFCKDEIKKGRQIYFVYPLIKESKAQDYKNLMKGLEQIMNFFSDYNITMVHGKMKPNEKDTAMAYFAAGKAKIMVATTVIEVGVNVPNASVMVIESSERFGLLQLHQLRGRVGRGAEQSYCILMTSDKLSKESKTRVKTMTETNDGFKISEMDMQLRGPGDILGTQQSGVVDFKRLNLINDFAIIKMTQNTVEKILKADPMLSRPDNLIIKNYYIKYYKGKNKWSKIS